MVRERTEAEPEAWGRWPGGKTNRLMQMKKEKKIKNHCQNLFSQVLELFLRHICCPNPSCFYLFWTDLSIFEYLFGYDLCATMAEYTAGAGVGGLSVACEWPAGGKTDVLCGKASKEQGSFRWLSWNSRESYEISLVSSPRSWRREVNLGDGRKVGGRLSSCLVWWKDDTNSSSHGWCRKRVVNTSPLRACMNPFCFPAATVGLRKDHQNI